MLKILRSDFIKAAGASVIAPDLFKEILRLFDEGKGTEEIVEALRIAVPQSDADTIITNLRALTNPGVTFSLDPEQHPDNTIRPGQPLHFTWQVHDWRFGEPTGKDLLGYENAVASLHVVSRSATGRGSVPAWTGSDRTVIVDPSLVPPLMYRVGGIDFHELVLRVKQTPASATDISARIHLLTVREDEPTWIWATGDQTVEWRQGYTMRGRIRNNAAYTSLTLNAILHQDAITFDNPLIPASAVSLPTPQVVTRSEYIDIPFAPEIRWTWDPNNWRWFNNVLLVIIGSLQRDFRYTVAISGSDSYGNQYDSLSSTQHVLVYVPASKRAALLVGFTAQLVAAAAVIMAIACLPVPAYGLIAAAVWMSVATTAEAIAQFGAALAIDPPELDVNFLEMVPLPQGKKEDQGKKGDQSNPQDRSGQAPSLAEFLIFARRIIQIPIFLSEVEGKMMGARQAQDANGIKMQNGSYMKGLQAMISDTHSLLELLPVVQKELEILPFDSQKIQAASQTVSKGFPQDVVTLLDKAEMPKEHRLLLEEAMMNADIMKQSQEIRSATEKLATAISELTIETRDISTKVFAPKRTKQKGLSQA